MADQNSENTLNYTPPVPDQPQSAPSAANQDAVTDPSLTRNSSFSKLNAQAPEFVPSKTQPSSPDAAPAPAPRVADPRLMIVPPPPPPPSAMVHVYPSPPNTPFQVPIPVQAPHLHHLHHPLHHHPHHQQQHHQHHPHQHHQPPHHHLHHHHSYQKHHQFHGGAGGEQEAMGHAQHDKDQGNGASRNGLSEEATLKLINQVEYYFSDVNLATTDHLIKFINKDPEGFVPISVVASFKKIKALISSNSQLAAVLRNSTKLVVSEDGKKVKRVHPLTGSDMEELQARIIVAENLPEDHCHQNLMKIFSAVGSVKSIRTCQPQPSNGGTSSASRPSKADNMLYSNKLHAFVEYESVELAEKAVVELNDEDDWRNGLRVRLLQKRGSKPAQARAKKAGNEGEVTCEEEDASTSEQNQNEKQSEDPSGQSDVHAHEQGEEQGVDKESGQKKSRNRGRGKGRGRGQHHHHHHHNNNNNNNNRGGNHVGGPPTNNTVNGEQPIVAKQQPPGPRMPDGTRGFSMGRGKPLTVISS